MDKAPHFERISRWLKDQFGSVETLESDAASIGTLLDRAEYDLDRLRKDLANVMVEPVCANRPTSGDARD